MSTCSDLVPMAPAGRLPIARMRALYRAADVEQRLDKLPAREHEHLRHTYERMLQKGPERFQVKPSGLPAMEHLYDELPNFHEALDDLRRQLALCQDSGDALEIKRVGHGAAAAAAAAAAGDINIRLLGR